MNRDSNGEIVGATLETILKDVLRIPFETKIARPADPSTDDLGDPMQVLVSVRNITNSIPKGFPLADPFKGEVRDEETQAWMVILQEDTQDSNHCLNGDNATEICDNDLDCPITGICLTSNEPCNPTNEGSDCPDEGDSCMPVDRNGTCGQHFSDIRVRHGDVIRIQYSSDLDGDGLFAREEHAVGSSDGKSDTDGDGLTDFQEVRAGWLVDINFVDPDFPNAKYSYRVYSDPRSVDQDGDGLTDEEERQGADRCPAVCDFDIDDLPLVCPCTDTGDATDPANPDTDDDGQLDSLDPLPLKPSKRLFVDDDNIDNDASNNGESWGNAFGTLKAALEAATSASNTLTHSDDIGEIWVAKGTYNDMNETLSVPSDINILGGFNGVEASRSDRNVDIHNLNTFVKGQLSLSGVQGVLMDGFAMPDISLGGLRNPILITDSTNISLRNLLLDGADTIMGGAVNILDSSWGIRIENCLFSDNTSAFRGAAITALFADAAKPSDVPTLEIIDCVFDGNSITNDDSFDLRGGTIEIEGADEVVIEDTKISGNRIIIEPSVGKVCGRTGTTCFGDGAGDCAQIPAFWTCKLGPLEDVAAGCNLAHAGQGCNGVSIIDYRGTCVLKPATDDVCTAPAATQFAAQLGGAIYFGDSSGHIRNSRFIDNRLEATGQSTDVPLLNGLNATGGALHFDQSGKPGKWEIVNCLFEYNRAFGYGGAIMHESDASSEFFVTNTTFVSNVVDSQLAVQNGAAVWGCVGTSSCVGMKMRNCIVFGGLASQAGPARINR